MNAQDAIERKGIRTKHLLQLLGASVVCGVLTWLPGIVLHFLRGGEFGTLSVIAITALMPIVSVGSVLAARRFMRSDVQFWLPALAALTVWIVGPTAMFIGAMPTGGGFAQPDAWQKLLFLTALFPIGTFSMATYEGNLGGLLISTAALMVLFMTSCRDVLRKRRAHR